MKIIPWITSAQQQIEVISQEQLIVTNTQVITSGCLRAVFLIKNSYCNTAVKKAKVWMIYCPHILIEIHLHLCCMLMEFSYIILFCSVTF